MKHLVLVLALALAPTLAFAAPAKYECSLNLFKKKNGKDVDYANDQFTYEMGERNFRAALGLHGFRAIVANNAANTSCRDGICADASPGINIMLIQGKHTASTFVPADQKVSSLGLIYQDINARLNCVKKD